MAQQPFPRENEDNASDTQDDAVFSDRKNTKVLLKDSRFADTLLIRSAISVLERLTNVAKNIISSAFSEKQSADKNNTKQR